MKTNLNGENFLLHFDDPDCEDRILIWSTVSDLEKLKSSNTWLIEGTFRIASKNFSQLYTIHGLIFDTRLPLVYCLMNKKNEKSYQKLFKILYAKILIMTKFIICDFEKAVLSTLRLIFSTSNIRTFHFYYAQALWRNIQKFNFVTNIN
ncbi:hypothetical protein DMUE_1313 [Dictyocoela muelleri]|nr:hypothetical protein DMUE_1313 [Dictyocoela muelleri]